MGKAGESRMVSHQAKKLDLDSLREFRDRFQLPLEDADLESLNFYKPAKSSDEMRYLQNLKNVHSLEKKVFSRPIITVCSKKQI